MTNLNTEIQKINSKIEELNKKKQELLDKEKSEQEKNKDKMIYTKIPELGIEISQQVYNNKTYAEILNLVKEEEIATHDILFKCRALTNKYPQFKDFWVFVPQPDKVSKDNNVVARFYADSDRADLGCIRYPTYSGASLGCFLYRRIKNAD